MYRLCVGIWEKMATSGTKPPKLSGHTFTKIERSKVVLFGGQTEGKCISDAYILSLDSWVGSCMASLGNRSYPLYPSTGSTCRQCIKPNTDVAYIPSHLCIKLYYSIIDSLIYANKTHDQESSCSMIFHRWSV